MRYGYSMVLREFLEAGEVEYGDCERFQVTCPACRAAVFKKTRERPDGAATHFLSHYRAGSADERDCELRVDAMVPEQVRRFNAESRGQALSRFMGVLRDEVVRGQAAVIPPDEHRRAVARVLSRPVSRDFVGYARSGLDALMAQPAPRQVVERMLATFPRFEDRSPFWRRRQAAYVVDVVQHLLAPQARGNLAFLAASAYVNLARNAPAYLARHAAGGGEDKGCDAATAYRLAEGLVNGRSAEALAKTAMRYGAGAAPRSPREAAERSDLARRALAGEAIGPMIGILAAVPWPDLASGRAREAPADALALLSRVAALLGGAPGR